MNAGGEINFSDITTINLDEYYPISRDNEQSYWYFMNKNLYSKVDIKPENIHIPNGLADDANLECKNYDKLICERKIDLQVLGVGANGHLGFNEPDDEMWNNTHITNLTDSTIEANSRFFPSKDDVPKQAITLGLGGIMKSKKILLLANGESKREPLQKLLSGMICTKVPVTLLNLHSDVVVITDSAAIGKSNSSF